MLDYGSIVYDSAAKTLLKKLDVILAQALRLCCGAFKTTPVSALQVEVGEMPLQIRRKQLKMNYLGKSSRSFRRPPSNSKGTSSVLGKEKV